MDFKETNMKLKHYRIVKELAEKYKKDKNVSGIYIFGSLASGKAKKDSDIDIEILLKKSKKEYELRHKDIDGIHIDLSLPREDYLIEIFKKYPYLAYSALKYNILYDPEGILKKYLELTEKYFQEHPEMKIFWRKKELAWKNYKKLRKAGKAKDGENYFDIMAELKRNKGKLK
jgi:predicted nucleotidyltransferase